MTIRNFPKSIILALLGIGLAIGYLLDANKPDAPNKYLRQPPPRPFPSLIAGEGIVEGSGGNIAVQPFWPGKVVQVYVHPGESVKLGAPLFKLDDVVVKGDVDVSREKVEASKQAYLQFKHAGASSYEIQRAKAEYHAEQVALETNQARLAQAVIRAPRDGEILEVNTHPGEFLTGDPRQKPILFSNTQQLQVRVDVDEINASLVKAGMPAQAYFKGDTSRNFPLRFVRIEPIMVPKANLNGSSTERVDVRVLQVIYNFEPPMFPVYIGQQLDIYIKR